MRTKKLATKVTLATASLALLSATPAVAAEASPPNATAEATTPGQSPTVRPYGQYLVKTYRSRASCYAMVTAHVLSGADGSMSCRKIYYAKPDVTNWQLWLTT